MDHNFELAFNLLDEAAGRIQTQQYGITRIPFHNHGDMLLTTVHDYTPETGHRLRPARQRRPRTHGRR